MTATDENRYRIVLIENLPDGTQVHGTYWVMPDAYLAVQSLLGDPDVESMYTKELLASVSEVAGGRGTHFYKEPDDES
jgi:hypothetical protein